MDILLATSAADYFGDYWVESGVPAQSGTLYWKQWGALYVASKTNVAGILPGFRFCPWFRLSGQWLFLH
jgi:hypothetical protein